MHGEFVAAQTISAAARPSLLLALLSAAGLTLYMQAWLDRRLGGYTGDNLGATQQAWAAEGGESENRPQPGQLVANLQPHSRNLAQAAALR